MAIAHLAHRDSIDIHYDVTDYTDPRRVASLTLCALF